MLFWWFASKKTQNTLSNDNVTYLHYVSVTNSHVPFLYSWKNILLLSKSEF